MSAPETYLIHGYTVEERRTTLLLNGRRTPWVGYSVTLPSPEGWPRWIGLALSIGEAEAMIARDMDWLDMVAGRKRERREERSAA